MNDWYVYPDWAYALGWTMTLSSVLMVPLWAVGQMFVTTGTFKQVSVDLLQSKQYTIQYTSLLSLNTLHGQL